MIKAVEPKVPSSKAEYIPLKFLWPHYDLVLISIPSLVETFNRVTRRVPHVEQELLILPEHPSFWTIKKLCSFSWTFPENSRFLFLYDVHDT